VKALRKSAILAIVILAAALASFYVGILAEARQADISSTYVSGNIPLTDPFSPQWSKVAGFNITLGGQTVVKPFKPTPSVHHVTVKILTNDTHISFLLTWFDSTKNDRAVKVDEFRDTVALLLAPAGKEALLVMGTVDTAVNILHWKADWQADIDKGFQDVVSAYPNFWVDIYPSAVGEPPYSVPKDFPDAARLYLVGWRVGNPLSQPVKVTPIEEANAKGFGSLASQEHQDALGRGVWEDGAWHVVIARRLSTGDGEDVQLKRGSAYSIAFAVWEGSSGDVGGRKSVSALHRLYLS
jgi:hypothetical protein